MKFILSFLLLVFVALESQAQLAIHNPAQYQLTRAEQLPLSGLHRPPLPAKSSELLQKLWFGGGFGLGFSGSGNISAFNLALAPMVGYKITPNFSVGPRIGFQFSYFRARDFNGDVDSATPLSVAFGIFSRYKIYRFLFAHAEYEIENEAFPIITSTGLEVERLTQNNVYIGLGYNESGYELLLLYNLNEDPNSINVPISLRAGFTWNF